MHLKKNFIRSLICVFTSLISFVAFTQNYHISGERAICPNIATEYSVRAPGDTLVWTITRGKITGDTITTPINNAGDHVVSITWNEVAVVSGNSMPSGRISVQQQGGTRGGDLAVAILSVRNWQTSIRVNSGAENASTVLYIPYGSTESFKISASELYPNTTANITDKRIENNEWTIPSANILLDNQGIGVSVGPWPFSGGQYITIKPASACTSIGATLQVRAMDQCHPNNANFYGRHRELHIERSRPTPSIAPSRSIVDWSVETQVTFTVSGTATAERYDWIVTGDFTETGTITTTTPSRTFTHRGCDLGTVRVYAVYCGVRSATSTTITVNTTQPAIQGNHQINTSSQYSISGIPSGTTVSWSTGGHLTPSSSSNNPVTFTSTVTGGACHSSWIAATISRNGCSRALHPRDVGVGSVPNVNLISSVYNTHTFTPFPQFFDDHITYNGQPVLYGQHGIIAGGWWSQTVEDAVEIDCPPTASVSGGCARIWPVVSNNNPQQVLVKLANHCGESNWVTITYGSGHVCWNCSQYPCGCCSDCGQHPCQCCHHCGPQCDGGCQHPVCSNCGYKWCNGECEEQCPHDPPCPLCCPWCTVYGDDDNCPYGCGWSFTFSPNPVGDVISVEFQTLQTNFNRRRNVSVQLLDATGRTQRESNFRHNSRNGNPNPVRFDVFRLPEGTYYLHVRIGGKIEKHQIIVKR